MLFRIRFLTTAFSLLLCLFWYAGAAAADTAMTADELIQGSHEHMRGETSYSEVTMTIHRPDWERVMELRAWTEGASNSLFVITAPPKDKNNGTLKRGREMWTYNPRINRVIKTPPSMMSQSWMGSDFSNNDLAKSDSILVDYTHELVDTEEREGHTVYTVQSTPKPMAPVVWGGQTMTIRDDLVMLQQIFLDELGEPVKIMHTEDVQMIDGRMFPKRWTMRKADAEGEYTRIEYDTLEFGVDLSPGLFTVQRLRNPPRR